MDHKGERRYKKIQSIVQGLMFCFHYKSNIIIIDDKNWLSSSYGFI